MNDPLESSRYSVEHAKRRINELEAEVTAFNQTNPYIQVVERDNNTFEDVFKIRLTQPVPIALKGIASDAVNAMRSALDNAGYAVAVAGGSKGGHAHFPFWGNAAEAAGSKHGRSKDIPKEIFDLMFACKPYKGGNDLLWALNKLSNTRKHEIVVPIIVSSGGFKISVGGGNGTIFNARGPFTIGGTHWNGAKNELEFMRVGLGGQIESDANFSFSLFVAFGEVDVIRGQPAIGVLRAMVDEVERVLMAIEAEAKRIRLFS